MQVELAFTSGDDGAEYGRLRVTGLMKSAEHDIISGS